jgi:DnaJ-domain-containing protein 1
MDIYKIISKNIKVGPIYTINEISNFYENIFSYEEYLNFKNWYHIEFSVSNHEETQFNRVPNEDYLLVSELPLQYQKLCQLLELGEFLSIAVLRKQYRKMVLMYHPDKMPQNEPEKIAYATQKLIKVKDAYEVLKKEYFKKR